MIIGRTYFLVIEISVVLLAVNLGPFSALTGHFQVLALGSLPSQQQRTSLASNL